MEPMEATIPRLGVIELSQLPPMQVLETLSTEAILNARMTQLVNYWSQNDPPNAAQYDVGGLEFDPIKIIQETSTYFEFMLRDRVNQAARSVTLAFAIGGDLDAIASRYPGGMPRLASETDPNYKTRIWLSPNTFTQNGMYENYIFFALTAAQTVGVPLRDAQAQATPGNPTIYITIMADGTPISALQDVNGHYTGLFTTYPSPVPTNDQIVNVIDYIKAPGMGRKGLTDVVMVNGPAIVNVALAIRVFLFPGWDQSLTMGQLYPALVTMLEKQRYLGYSLTLSSIDEALKVSGVHSIIVDRPLAPPSADLDVLVPLSLNQAIQYTSISITYAGRAGVGPLPPNT